MVFQELRTSESVGSLEKSNKHVVVHLECIDYYTLSAEDKMTITAYTGFMKEAIPLFENFTSDNTVQIRKELSDRIQKFIHEQTKNRQVKTIQVSPDRAGLIDALADHAMAIIIALRGEDEEDYKDGIVLAKKIIHMREEVGTEKI